MASQDVFGQLIPYEFLVAHYCLEGTVHSGSARDCATIAATHLGGLRNKVTIHPGAGFGADMWAVHMHGVRQAIGLEVSLAQVQQSELLIRHPDASYACIASNKVVQGLYISTKRTNLFAEIRGELSRQLWSHEWVSATGIDNRQCNILNSDDVEATLGGIQGDAVIGNFLLHTIKCSTVDALELIAPMVKHEGIVVLSLPSQTIALDNEEQQRENEQRSIFKQEVFRERLNTIFASLAKQGINPNPPPQPILESDLKKGSPSLKFIGSHSRAFRAAPKRERDTIAGLLLFVGVLSTDQPADNIAPLVRMAMDKPPYAKTNKVGIDVHYFVFRKQ